MKETELLATPDMAIQRGTDGEGEKAIAQPTKTDEGQPVSNSAQVLPFTYSRARWSSHYPPQPPSPSGIRARS